MIISIRDNESARSFRCKMPLIRMKLRLKFFDWMEMKLLRKGGAGGRQGALSVRARPAGVRGVPKKIPAQIPLLRVN